MHQKESCAIYYYDFYCKNKHENDQDHDIEQWIEDIIHEIKDLGYVDDKRLARNLIEKYYMKGTGVYKIKNELQKKYIPKEIIHLVLKEIEAEKEILGDDDERTSFNQISLFAQKKKLGIYREKIIESEEDYKKTRQKEIQKMLYQGFSYDIINSFYRKTGDGYNDQ